MPDKTPRFNFLATGIGSVPFQDIESTCRKISGLLPAIPFWPQFVRRSCLEDMSIQFSEGLPLLEIREEKRSLVISSTKEMEGELVLFYDHYLQQDIDYFSISEKYAPGLHYLRDLIKREPSFDCRYIKGQTVGPVTFAAGIIGMDGKPVLHNAELMAAMARGLAIKALWQARELGKTGKQTIIFLDEPYLSGFGSAFTSIQRHEVIDILRIVIDYLRDNSDTLIGIHCCGNTDWPMIIEAGPDIINFDAFEFMDYFLLYSREIVKFLKSGGAIAWGMVPTSDFAGDKSTEGLSLKLKEGLNRVHRWGIDPGMLAEHSLITPSCGMGGMTPEAAEKSLVLLSGLSRTFAK